MRTSAGGWRLAAREWKAIPGLHSFLLALAIPCVRVGGGELDLPPLAEGEAVQSESFEIDGSGRFVWTRTTSRQAGSLGVEIWPVDAEAAARLSVPPYVGLLVTSVEGGGPADRSGIIRDDIIFFLGSRPAVSPAQFSELVQDTPPGTQATLGFLREGTRRDVPVTLGSRGRVSSASVSRELPVIDDRARMGMVLADPGPEVSARMRGAPGAPGGLLVAEILPGGPAFFAGLHRGDLLAEVAGRPVRTGEDWLSAPEAAVPAKPVDLVLFRHGRRLEARAVPVEDATGVRELDGPLWVFSLKRSAPEDRFSLLWGLLWRSRSMHEVLDLGTREEHTSSCEVGALLDIFRYRSRDGRSEMRFLWVIPIYSRSRFTLESRQ